MYDSCSRLLLNGAVFQYPPSHIGSYSSAPLVTLCGFDKHMFSLLDRLMEMPEWIKGFLFLILVRQNWVSCVYFTGLGSLWRLTWHDIRGFSPWV